MIYDSIKRLWSKDLKYDGKIFGIDPGRFKEFDPLYVP
jgi:hypothetical protein